MIEHKRKKMSKRKIGLIITLVDFLIIFMFIFYSNKYFTNSKTIKINGLILNYKYFALKNDIGYMFNFSIKNAANDDITVKIGNSGVAVFYIKYKKKIIWNKNSRFNDKFIKIKNLDENSIKTVLKKDNLIMYNEIYDNYKNKFLKKGEYVFGVKINVNNKDYILEKKRDIE